MAPRRRKKKPPDLLSIPLVSPSPRSSIVDQNRSLPFSRVHLQSVVGVQSRPSGWLRFQPLSSTICNSRPIRVTVPRSAIVEDRWQDWQFDSVSLLRHSRCSSAASVGFRNGLRSVIIGNRWHDWQFDSVSLRYNSYCSWAASGMVLFPFLFAVSPGRVRALYSRTLLSLFSELYICWKGSLCGTWPWQWLIESGLDGVDFRFWWFGLEFGTSMVCNFISWKLVYHGHGFVILPCRHLGSAGLFLKSLLIPSLLLACLVWVILVYAAMILSAWRLRVVLFLQALICQSSFWPGSLDRTMFSWYLYMLGLFGFHWHCNWLGLIRLDGIEVHAVLAFWVFILQFNLSKLWSCLLWILDSLEFKFVFTHGSPVGGAWLIFQILSLAGCLLICIPGWDGQLCFRICPLTNPCSPLPRAFGMMFLRWIVIVCLGPSLLFSAFLYLVLYVVQPLTFVWLWWQGSCSSVTPSPPLVRRLPPSLCVDQHVYMLRMYLCMLGIPPLGGWTQLWLLKFISSSSVVWIVTFLCWAFSSSSLSLLLVSKYAQRRVPLHSGLCWHLGFLQTVWDEVKGKCPLVYEDLLSETRNSVYLRFFWFRCSLSGCLLAGLQLSLYQDELKTALGYKAYQHDFGLSGRLCGMTLVVWQLTVDPRPIPSVRKPRTDTRTEACNKVFGTHGCMADYFILMIVFSFRMYWTNMIVLERIHFVDDEADNYLGGDIIHLCTNCNICFSEQHLCVLGMCLMALDLRHKTHRPVPQGQCLNNFGVACMESCFDCIDMLELGTLLEHICMACMATPPLSYGFVSSGWLCVICGLFPLCILEFQHWTIFDRLRALSC